MVGSVRLLTIVADQLQADPLGGAWLDGQRSLSIRDLAAEAATSEQAIAGPGCLLDVEAIAVFDDRAVSLLSALTPYLR